MTRPTTAVAKPTSKNLPATLAADMAAEVVALSERLMAPTGDKIKVENKSFKLPNGDISDTLHCIIVDFVYYNTYYEAAYEDVVHTSPV